MIKIDDFGTSHLEGGHAIVAVGYDERMRIKNKYGKVETTGALLIRN